MAQPKFVIVKWIDASSDTEWKDGSEAAHEPVTCWTTGWVVVDDADRIVLSQTITSDEGRGHEWSIPKGCVVRRRVIRMVLP